LQRAAVCCSVLQRVAACCSALQYRQGHPSLPCVAACCSVLQCVTVWCSVLQRVIAWCSVLQRVAVCCSVLQCVMLQYREGDKVAQLCRQTVNKKKISKVSPIISSCIFCFFPSVSRSPKEWQKRTAEKAKRSQDSQETTRNEK